MACRIVNLHTQPLHIDLRGGDRLLLASGEWSSVLREEQLYDNHHLDQWERAGWVRRIPARMSELHAEQAAAAQAANPEGKTGRKGKEKPEDQGAGAASPPAVKKTQVSR